FVGANDGVAVVGSFVGAKGGGVAVVGLEVPHAHIHLVPLQNIGDLNFTNQRKEFSAEEYKAIAADIRQYLNS
ncbi:MAG: hypothetical protein ACK445_11770, partial [Bacteroidota bacterium]